MLLNAHTYIDIVRKRFDLLRRQEDRFRSAASLIVEQVLGGGVLWIFDREQALLWEANVKAAGLFITNNQYTPQVCLVPGDILLMGAVEPDIPENTALAEKVRREGGKVIAITPTSLIGRNPRGKFLAEVVDIVLGVVFIRPALFLIRLFDKRFGSHGDTLQQSWELLRHL